MGLKLGELIAYLKIDKSDFDKDLVKSQVELVAAGKAMGREADKAGRDIGDGLGKGTAAGVEKGVRDAQGKLRDSRGRFIREGQAAGEAAGGGVDEGFKRRTRNTFNLGREISGLQSKIRDMAREFARTGDTSILGNLKQAQSQLRELQQVASLTGSSGLASFGSSLVGIGQKAAAAAPFLLKLVGIIGAIAGAIALAAPLIGGLGGLLGSLPALAAGGAAGIATLVLGFSGLADHMKKTSSAGGGVVDRAYQILQAERRLRDANEEATDSQKALTQARKDAAEQLDDLNRSLANAQLDQRSAVMAVADAQRELQAAQESGNTDAIARAQLRYDQAVQSLSDIQDRVSDLTEEQQKSAKAGIEGSDAVIAAKHRERAAVEGVQDAEHALQQTRAQGGGGGAAAQLAAIAPAAQKVIDKLHQLKPAFDNLRLSVQQRLFAGVSDKIQLLADRWLPVLKSKLGDTADVINHAFKTFADTSTQPGFIDKISTALDSVNKLLDKVGQAAAGPLADALATLAAAAKPFVDALGDGMSKAITDFANWIKEADKSGKLDRFFDKATKFFKDLEHVGKTTLGIVGDILATLFNAPKDGKSNWESFMDTLDRLKKWLDDPENQKKLQRWIERIEEVGKVIGKAALAVATFINYVADGIEELPKIWEKIKKGWNHVVDDVKSAGEKVIDWIKGLPGRVTSAASGMFDGIKDSFKAALNWVIDAWNGLEFKLPEANFLGVHLGGGTPLKTPHVPRLKDGGIVPATPGGRMVITAEGGKDEAVAPLDRLVGIVTQAVTNAMHAVGGGEMTLDAPIDLGEGIEQVVTIKMRRKNRQTRRVVGARVATAGAR